MLSPDTVASLCQRHHVDAARARHVADLALTLFDGTRDFHQLGARARALVEMGAQLCEVGAEADAPNRHIAGRDIVIASSLEGVSPQERAVVALMVTFHRRSVDPSAEPLFGALEASDQRLALVTSAIVRVADGLDSSRTQATNIAALAHEVMRVAPASDELDREQHIPAIRLDLVGPYCHEDAARALKRADVWTQFLPPLRVTAKMNRPGLSPEMPLGAAGRRILRYYFDALPTLNDASDDKDIRKLRVVARRMRLMLRAFRPHFRKKAVRFVGRGLRDLERVTGPAREADLLLGRLAAFEAANGLAESEGLRQLGDEWRERQANARRELRQHLDSKRHRRWREGVTKFVKSAKFDREADLGAPALVRHVAARALDEAWAGVAAFDVMPPMPVPEDVHALRIAAKNLRYVTEAYRETLPPDDARDIIEACVAAQNDLGGMHDAYVSADAAMQFVTSLPATREGRRNIKDVVLFAEAEGAVAAQSLDVQALAIFGVMAGRRQRDAA